MVTASFTVQELKFQFIMVFRRVVQTHTKLHPFIVGVGLGNEQPLRRFKQNIHLMSIKRVGQLRMDFTGIRN